MFWGLIMEPEKRYSQVVKRSFHISMAALVTNTSDNQPIQVMCCIEERNYLLCTLQKDKIMQIPLDLNFERGDEISFAVNGNSHVHLTGYLNDDILDDVEEEEDDDEEVQEEEQQTTTKKRKATTNGESRKKLKTLALLEDVNDSEDEDDSDFDIDEKDDDDSEEDAEEEGNEEDVFDENEDEEVEEFEKKVNGVAKKKKGQEVKQAKDEKQTKPGKENKARKEEKPAKGQKKTVEGGVTIEDVRVGNGNIAKPGKSVQVYYEGRFQKNNKMFDSATKGNGFKFRLGKQEVIKGWDVGIQGMKVGGKRKIVCPPNMAYGAKGSPPVIPPNSTLVFEVELKNVN